jgi:hypothetical protein
MLFCGALSRLISSFSSLISMISGLIALYIIAFISSILGILDILPIGITGITLGDDLVVEENIELPELARNSYISSFSSSVFCRFCGIIGYYIYRGCFWVRPILLILLFSWYILRWSWRS